MTQEELNKVLERHLHWLQKDCDGWEDMRAILDGENLDRLNLYRASLNGASLYKTSLEMAFLDEASLNGALLDEASLYKASLNGASLNGASLNGASLEGASLNHASLVGTMLIMASLDRASLIGTSLNGASLNGASLKETSLDGASLNGASLNGTSLKRASLNGASFYNASIKCTSFYKASLDGASLYKASLDEVIDLPFIPFVCPDTGAFIGWKKTRGKIIKLEVPADAKRCSAASSICRCDKAKVLEIQEIDGRISDATKISSDYDITFIYEVGKTVSVKHFCEDRWRECCQGIHFFINRQSAVEY